MLHKRFATRNTPKGNQNVAKVDLKVSCEIAIQIKHRAQFQHSWTASNIANVEVKLLWKWCLSDSNTSFFMFQSLNSCCSFTEKLAIDSTNIRSLFFKNSNKKNINRINRNLILLRISHLKLFLKEKNQFAIKEKAFLHWSHSFGISGHVSQP